jgi:hypothetical protein
MRIRHFIALLLCLGSVTVIAQTTQFRGRIVDSESNLPLKGISVWTANASQAAETLDDGTFAIDVEQSKATTLSISGKNYPSSTYVIDANAILTGEITIIYITAAPISAPDIPTIIIGESDDASSGVATQNIQGLLSASNDIYLSETGYNFGAIRFYVRGLENEYTHSYINGVSFNDAERGRFNYGMLGGLNDATRNRDVSGGIMPSMFGFGDIGGITHIDTRAANYSKGTKLTLSGTNRNYKLRGAATYATGLMDNGWAVTGSMAFRWADEGYVAGTSYNSLGYFLSVEKVFGPDQKHRLSLTTLGAPTLRGQQGASVQEAYDLAGTNYYNPYWGWQNGEKRNSRMVNTYDPTAIISHTWKINDKSKLTSGFGTHYNQYGSTALNWYKASDPRPDYYRKLPSYETMQSTKDSITHKWQTDENIRQLDWVEMYLANYKANTSDSSGRYMVEERINNLFEMTANSVFTTKPSDKQTLLIGLDLRASRGYHYKRANDLLGANYWRDVDQFADRDFPNNDDKLQNDMNNPDRKIYKNDIFGYNYNMDMANANFWIQNEYRLPKVDFFYAAKLSYSSFQREGKMRNGRAPDNSYGKGEKHEFVNQAFKMGGTYKITGRHFINANGLYETRAPLASRSYLSQRIKDDAIPNLQNERIASIDVGYMLNTRILTGRLTAYHTRFFDQNELSSFYHDAERTYVNYVLSNISKTHQGFELGMEAKITNNLSLTAVGTLAEYRYNNRPEGYVSYENGSKPDYTETVYFKNYFVGGSPQTAASLGLHYFKNFWFFDVNYNFFDRNYVDIAPMQRTASAMDFLAESQEERDAKAKAITNQEKYDAGGTLDASVGRSMRVFNRKHTLNINLSFSNILNNTNLKSGGFEQGRYDFETSNVDKFPPKYYYAQGLSFFLNIGLKL